MDISKQTFQILQTFAWIINKNKILFPNNLLRCFREYIDRSFYCHMIAMLTKEEAQYPWWSAWPLGTINQVLCLIACCSSEEKDLNFDIQAQNSILKLDIKHLVHIIHVLAAYCSSQCEIWK